MTLIHNEATAAQNQLRQNALDEIGPVRERIILGDS
jgi:hypothetical protein